MARVDTKALARVLSWLGPTRTSEKGRITSPTDVDPLQMFWGMPRRIRLEFTQNSMKRPCDITGVIDDIVVTSYRTKPHGTHYEGGWSHALTPSYRVKATDPTALPVHAQPGGIGYRQWVGMVQGDADGLRFPAPCVSAFRSERRRELGKTAQRWRLLAGGYVMDNMKARSFIESEMPIIEGVGLHQGDFEVRVRQMLKGAEVVSSLLSQCVRHALFPPGALPDSAAGAPGDVRQRFWIETQIPFLDLLEILAAADTPWPELAQRWRTTLRAVAVRLFDEVAPLDALAARAPERHAAARRRLTLALHGFGKDGDELSEALGLPVTRSKPDRKRTS
jgi:CRISPR system Cascade subunit CasA